MRPSWHGVLEEPESRLHRQLFRHVQIPLRFMHAPMAQVRRQMGQETLHVLPIAVPADEAIHRERVTEVMQAWPEGSARWALQPGLLPHALEDEFSGLAQDRPTLMIRQ